MDGMQRAQWEIAIDKSIEAFPGLSKLLKSYYDELLKAGFNEEQAMRLVVEESLKFNI